ncbi:hypothetical protein CDV55_107354 [Aspergillus turcosus]|nr:hypothetical protein CDV55_107354 [Aspergillus turcosus]
MLPGNSKRQPIPLGGFRAEIVVELPALASIVHELPGTVAVHGPSPFKRFTDEAATFQYNNVGAIGEEGEGSIDLEKVAKALKPTRPRGEIFWAKRVEDEDDGITDKKKQGRVDGKGWRKDNFCNTGHFVV